MRSSHLAPIAVLLGVAAASVHAAPADYVCNGDRPLRALMTPREANLELEGQKMVLRRVRDKGDARYVNAAAGMALTLKRSSAELERKGQETLVCKLQQRAFGAKP